MVEGIKSMILNDALLSYKGLILILILLLFSVFIGLGFYMFFTRKSSSDVVPFSRSKRTELPIPKDNIAKLKLDNGMTVLVFKNKSVPKVLVQIAYDVGSFVEQSGEQGLAHLIEHMIFKGTNKLSESDIFLVAKNYGADFSAYTSKDVTSYLFEADKNNWEPFVAILADCMQNARFDKEHLASELKTVIQELKMYKDSFWRMMFERASELIFPTNHPYHRPIIGYKEDLTNLSAENLKAFYKRHYGPENATLFIVGDVEMEHALEIAQKNFGSVKSSGKKESKDKYFPQIFQNLTTNKTRIYENIKTEQLGFYWLIPGLKEDIDVIVDMAEFILGGGQGSRLYKRLVDKEKIATSVGVVAHQLMESGAFLILIEPMSGKIEDCRRVVQEELNNFISNGVSEKELEKVIKTKRRAFFQILQGLKGFTNEWIHSYFAQEKEFALFEKINKFYDIDSAQIQNFASKYLDPFLMSQIEMVPIPEDKKDLWQEAKKQSDELDKKILEKYARSTSIEDPKFAKSMVSPNPLEFKFPQPHKRFKLENGLEVILRQNKQWPIFTLNCQFKEADFWGKSKESILIELMMSMLLEGSIGFSKEENVEFFETLGAAAFFDESGGKLSGLSDDCYGLIKRFFHILTKPKFSKTAFYKLQNIFIDAIERAKDSAIDVGQRELKNLIYKDHPYQWTFDEAIESLKNSSIKELENLHKKCVSPKNIILSIAGSFDLDEMENRIKGLCDSGWQGEFFEKPKDLKRNFESAKKLDHFMLRDQVVLFLGQPSQIDIYHEDRVPLRLLNLICFASLGSRIYDLRMQAGMFYTAFGGFGIGEGKEKGFDVVGSILSLDKLDDAEVGMKKMIEQVAQGGISEQELNSARRQYLKILIDLASSNEAVSAMLANLKAFELGFDYYDKVLDRIQKIKKEELDKIAKKYFTTNDLARVRVGRVK